MNYRMITMKPVLAVALAGTVALTAACGAPGAGTQARVCHGAGSVLSGVESGVRHLAHAGSPGSGGHLDRDCRKLLSLHDSVRHR